MYSKSKSLWIDKIGPGRMSFSDVLKFSQQPSDVIDLHKNGVYEPDLSTSSLMLLPIRVSIILGSHNMKLFIISFSELVLGPRL